MKEFYSKISRVFFTAFVVVALHGVAGAENKALPQLKITYNNDDLNYDTYIPGTMVLTDVGGEALELAAMFKTRGATAREYSMKPALNMKLTDADGNELDENLLGLRKASSFILDAMAIDRINMRNRVAFDIWNSFSRLPYETDFGSRNGTVGKFVEMYINGKYKGIYCLSDKINRKLLDLKKPDVDEVTGEVTIRGLLYKNGTNDIDDQNTPGYYNNGIVYVINPHDAWELHEPEEYSYMTDVVWGPLNELYAGNNYANYKYVKEHFWLDNLADYTILIMALCIEDNWGNKNKYLSIQNVTKSGDKRKFVVTPWDLDASFGGNYNGSKYDGDYTDWSVEDIAKSAPLPFAACLSQPDFKELLKQRWIEGSLGAFAVDSVKQRLFDTCALFEESGAWKRTVDYWKTQRYTECYVDDLSKEVGLVAEWYENRFKLLDEYFGISDKDREEWAGVSIIENKPAGPDVIYNIQGMRVDRMNSPGLYIINGKKILVK